MDDILTEEEAQERWELLTPDMNEVAHLYAVLNPDQQMLADMFINGKKLRDIGQRFGHGTVWARNRLAEGAVRDYIHAYWAVLQRTRIPDMEERAKMLWGIAHDTKDSQPRVAISAIDTLNKMTGVYVQDDASKAIPSIVINQFNIEQKDRETLLNETLNFAPITVEVNDDTTDPTE